VKPLFIQGPSLFARALVFALVSIALVVADNRLDLLSSVRHGIANVITPVYWVVDLPSQFGVWFSESTQSRRDLIAENEALKTESMVVKAMAQRMAVLEAENAQLRSLLNSSAQLKGKLQIAELIAISPDPDYHTVVINRGNSDGVYVGQVVLDASGIMGQIVEVHSQYSRAILISDSSHTLPVEVNRNGVRALLSGEGRLDKLSLLYVPATTDIAVGDLLISSGLGQRFPRGYPVAQVTNVDLNSGQPFATIEAEPMAELNKGRYVLLLFAETSVVKE
jgi:rod shape-determining protein MreC